TPIRRPVRSGACWRSAGVGGKVMVGGTTIRLLGDTLSQPTVKISAFPPFVKHQTMPICFIVFCSPVALNKKPEDCWQTHASWQGLPPRCGHRGCGGTIDLLQ